MANRPSCLRDYISIRAWSVNMFSTQLCSPHPCMCHLTTQCHMNSNNGRAVRAMTDSYWIRKTPPIINSNLTNTIFLIWSAGPAVKVYLFLPGTWERFFDWGCWREEEKIRGGGEVFTFKSGVLQGCWQANKMVLISNLLPFQHTLQLFFVINNSTKKSRGVSAGA